MRMENDLSTARRPTPHRRTVGRTADAPGDRGRTMLRYRSARCGIRSRQHENFSAGRHGENESEGAALATFAVMGRRCPLKRVRVMMPFFVIVISATLRQTSVRSLYRVASRRRSAWNAPSQTHIGRYSVNSALSATRAYAASISSSFASMRQRVCRRRLILARRDAWRLGFVAASSTEHSPHSGGKTGICARHRIMPLNRDKTQAPYRHSNLQTERRRPP